jgi:hypothetical protein
MTHDGDNFDGVISSEGVDTQHSQSLGQSFRIVVRTEEKGIQKNSCVSGTDHNPLFTMQGGPGGHLHVGVRRFGEGPGTEVDVFENFETLRFLNFLCPRWTVCF